MHATFDIINILIELYNTCYSSVMLFYFINNICMVIDNIV